MTSLLAPLCALLLAFAFTFAPATEGVPLTVKSLEKALAANPAGTEAQQINDELVGGIRSFIGPDIANLSKLPAPKIDELSVAWGIEVPNAQAPPKVVSDDGKLSFTLTRAGNSNVYAGVKHFNWGEAYRWYYEIDGRKLMAGNGQLEVYTTHPDSKEQPGVPKGKLIQMPKWTSKIFEGTTRDWWVYVPAQYDGKAPACLMVFQDGDNLRKETGDTRATIVMDNLIHKKQMPVTIGVFINPGNDPKTNPPPKAGEKAPKGKPFKPNNRSFEYDTLSDAYSRFLMDEILPAVKGMGLKITDDPDGRAICGNSSGGICAFTVAWNRTDSFHKVVSHVGSFTNIRGGHEYPFMIRKEAPKPIRIFMQDGKHDADNQFGNWYLGALQMDSAFAYANRTADEAKGEKKTDARYDVKLVIGDGVHSGKHGGAIFPDTLRWLWRDFPGVQAAEGK